MWAANGMIARLVAICSGCNVMSPFGALLTGIDAGLMIKPAFKLEERLKIDDVVAACTMLRVSGAR